MISLQDIQFLKNKLQGVRDKTIQAQTMYENTIDRIKTEVTSIVSLLSEDEKKSFCDKFENNVFKFEDDKVSEIIDIDKISEVSEYLEETVLSQIDKDITENYEEIKEKIEEWEKIVRGEQNESAGV